LAIASLAARGVIRNERTDGASRRSEHFLNVLHRLICGLSAVL